MPDSTELGALHATAPTSSTFAAEQLAEQRSERWQAARNNALLKLPTMGVARQRLFKCILDGRSYEETALFCGFQTAASAEYAITTELYRFLAGTFPLSEDERAAFIQEVGLLFRQDAHEHGHDDPFDVSAATTGPRPPLEPIRFAQRPKPAPAKQPVRWSTRRTRAPVPHASEVLLTDPPREEPVQQVPPSSQEQKVRRAQRVGSSLTASQRNFLDLAQPDQSDEAMSTRLSEAAGMRITPADTKGRWERLLGQLFLPDTWGGRAAAVEAYRYWCDHIADGTTSVTTTSHQPEPATADGPDPSPAPSSEATVTDEQAPHVAEPADPALPLEPAPSSPALGDLALVTSEAEFVAPPRADIIATIRGLPLAKRKLVDLLVLPDALSFEEIGVRLNIQSTSVQAKRSIIFAEVGFKRPNLGPGMRDAFTAFELRELTAAYQEGGFSPLEPSSTSSSEAPVTDEQAPHVAEPAEPEAVLEPAATTDVVDPPQEEHEVAATPIPPVDSTDGAAPATASDDPVLEPPAEEPEVHAPASLAAPAPQTPEAETEEPELNQRIVLKASKTISKLNDLMRAVLELEAQTELTDEDRAACLQVTEQKLGGLQVSLAYQLGLLALDSEDRMRHAVAALKLFLENQAG